MAEEISNTSYVTTHLERNNSGFPMTVYVEWAVKKADNTFEEGSYGLTTFGSITWDNVIKDEELQRTWSELSPSDILTVTCRMSSANDTSDTTSSCGSQSKKRKMSEMDRITEREAKKPDTKRVRTLIRNLKHLYRNRLVSDVKIRVRNRKFMAHKAILAARSPVFAAMFNHAMAEKNIGTITLDENTDIVILDDSTDIVILDDNTDSRTLDDNTGNRTLDDNTDNRTLDINTGNRNFDDNTHNRTLDINTGNRTLDDNTGNRTLDVSDIVYVKDEKPNTVNLKANNDIIILKDNYITVTLDDCDPYVFDQFLNFLYSGEVESLSDNNVCGLYYVADKYDLPELKEECAEFMSRNITLENFSDVVRLAHNDSEVLDSAIVFFAKNVELILHTSGWKKLLVENAELANEFYLRCYTGNRV